MSRTASPLKPCPFASLLPSFDYPQHGLVERTAAASACVSSPGSFVQGHGDHQYLYDNRSHHHRRHFLVRRRGLHRSIFYADRL